MRLGPRKPHFQTWQGGADGLRQKPHGGGHRLHGDRHQQWPDAMEGRSRHMEGGTSFVIKEDTPDSQSGCSLLG